MGMKGDDLNVELNLTSMIDLMSVLVAFLLVTAVWLNISAIQSKVESKGKAPASVSKPEDNLIEVKVTRYGHQIKWPKLKSGLPSRLRKSKDGYDLAAVTAWMEKAVKQRSDLNASVTGEDRVDYGAVAETIDAVNAGGISAVSLATN